ncbi:MAG: type II toxin-antitoxin system VapC family toxin [Methanobacteriaceae archaeon]
MKIMVDACFIVAFIVNDEKDHKRALDLYKKLEKHDLYISRAILIEVINLLTKRLKGETKELLEIYEAIKYEYRIVEVNEELSDNAMQTILKYDGNLGLADSINIETMKELNIYKIYSFDPDFDNKEGIVRVY